VHVPVGMREDIPDGAAATVRRGGTLIWYEDVPTPRQIPLETPVPRDIVL